MSEANVQLVRSGWEAIARGDLEAIRDLLDPEVRWHGGDPNFAGACHNREQALRFMRRARVDRGIPEIVELIDAGDQVVVILKPSDSDELRANLTRLRDGKVIEMIAFDTPEQAIAAARAPD